MWRLVAYGSFVMVFCFGVLAGYLQGYKSGRADALTEEET